jgi:hypothetical protein
MVSIVKSATRTRNVRISPDAHELLRQLAEEEDDSMQAVSDKAIEGYRHEKCRAMAIVIECGHGAIARCTVAVSDV